MAQSEYSFRIKESLLHTLVAASGKPKAFVMSHILSCIEKMLTLEPNIKRYVVMDFKRRGKRIVRTEPIAKNKKIWVYRDFFPDTQVMFKISAVYQPPQPVNPNDPWNNDDLPDITWAVVSPIENKKKSDIRFMPQDIAKLHKQLAEYELLGADIELPMNKQRRLAPKGMPLQKQRKSKRKAS